LIGIAAIVGRLGAGWLLDRVRVSHLMPVFMLAGAAACIVYAMPAPAALLTISAFALGMVVGAEFDALAYAIRRYHGLLSFGAVYGWIFAIFQLGSAIGAVGLGVVHNTYHSYVPGMFAFAVICAAAALTFACFGPYRFHAKA
jgi:predicted MFS family arabinose efflux permease